MECDHLNHVIGETDTLIFKQSPIHGTGAFSKRPITRGTRVIEYLGEKIEKAESLRRCQGNNEFIFSLNEREDLDGNVPWNLARFINHSCMPNCEAIVEEQRIWIIALRDIDPANEVTFNYGYDLMDYREYPCRCGALECVGYIVAEEFFEHVRTQRAV